MMELFFGMAGSNEDDAVKFSRSKSLVGFAREHGSLSVPLAMLPVLTKNTHKNMQIETVLSMLTHFYCFNVALEPNMIYC